MTWCPADSSDSLCKYLSYWLMYRVLGQSVGGAVNLGLNARNDKAGSLSTDTYLVFVVLQCLGPFVALLLSLPHQVQRSDGTPVLLNLQPSVKRELLAMVQILKTKKVLLLLPLIWQGTFSEALVGTYAAAHFTVRSRALGSLLSAIVAAMACYILGYLLDNQRWSINRRGKGAFLAIYAMQLAWWAWAIYTMNKYHKEQPTLDFGQSEWSRGFAVYIFLQIGFNLMCEKCGAFHTALSVCHSRIAATATPCRRVHLLDRRCLQRRAGRGCPSVEHYPQRRVCRSSRVLRDKVSVLLATPERPSHSLFLAAAPPHGALTRLPRSTLASACWALYRPGSSSERWAFSPTGPRSSSRPSMPPRRTVRRWKDRAARKCWPGAKMASRLLSQSKD